jgi:RNA polymerase sigma factor (sigma-70 family)
MNLEFRIKRPSYRRVDSRRLRAMGERLADDDATLVRRIAEDQDERALAELLERHVPKVTEDLRYRFRQQLQHPEIDEAVNLAAMKLWKNADSFDESQRFGPWFLTIAQNAALDILRGEKRRPTCELAFDPPAQDSDCLDEEPEHSPKVQWCVAQLEQIIESELKGFEQVVALADLAAGGPGAADTELLMRQHEKTKNNVQVTRSKVWKKIREMIRQREALRHHTKVNQ